ncbi:hypothetical protein BG015_003832 [Linnemannia schmuckeri]|uniref:MCMDC2 N-terminal domain-containing protein n=1 Tax=Linnemannia schmuckeri TaxID=64567 RepID=A0A9P5S2J9_9FUNG|nr:hypothetical protein BG015_003832 [Linnemannia schmuckeri]
MMDVRQAITESNTAKVETRGSISRYMIRMIVDPIELSQTCASLGNQLLCDIESIEPDVHLVCCQILQQFMSLEENALLAEQVRVCLRVKYSQTFLCVNPRCNNKNYLHFTPSAARHRVIKRAKDNGFMETGTDAALLNIDLTCSHCDWEMPESVLDRVYTKQQKITVECLGVHRAEGCFVNQVELLLQDDLADIASLGEHIQLIGRVYRSFPEKNHDTYLHGIQMDVNNLIHLPGRRDQETISETIAAIVTSNMSPWNTSQAIVDLFDVIVPSSIYRKLKLALLLSAVSLDSRDSKNLVAVKEMTVSIRRSIHVLVVMNGQDTIVPALMASIAALKRWIFWDHGEETARKLLYSLHQPKKSTTGEIRASEMSAAKDGIVLFELDQLDKNAQAHITPVLTTVNGSNIGIQRDNLSQQLDLICCCWATHTSIELSSKKSKSRDPVFEEDITGPAHRVPLNEQVKFDIVVGQQELDAASDVALSVAAHTLRQHMKDGGEGGSGPSKQLSREDLSQYLHIASSIQVRFACDRLPTDTTRSSGVIMMMEETIAARFGTSCLGFVPLLDGKENVTRLYAQSEQSDILLDQGQSHAAPHVPVFESNSDMEMDIDDPSAAAVLANTDVPTSLQEARDQVMDAMYVHLTRVISEYAYSIDI